MEDCICLFDFDGFHCCGEWANKSQRLVRPRGGGYARDVTVVMLNDHPFRCVPWPNSPAEELWYMVTMSQVPVPSDWAGRCRRECCG